MSKHYVTQLHEDMLARARDENHALAVHADALAWHLLHAEAERDDALWVLERVRETANGSDSHGGYLENAKALRRIRDTCDRHLTPRAQDGGRE